MGIPVAALLLTSRVPLNKSQFCFLVYKGDGQYLTKRQQLRVFNKIMVLRMLIHCEVPYQSGWYDYLQYICQNGIVQQTLKSSSSGLVLETVLRFLLLLYH